MSNGQRAAFPYYMSYPNGNESDYGMNKREYFAGLSMQAHRMAEPDAHADKIAAWAVGDADALLAALESKT